MKKIISLLFILSVGASSARADLTVSKTAGVVETQASEGAAWTAVSAGSALPEGSAVRTGADGEAELTFPDRSKVWMKANSQLQVENQRPLLNRLSFLFGSIKAAIPHLKRNQRFEVKTNTAVAAVRGTEFTMDLTKEGRLFMMALYGELRMKVEGISGEYKVPQGQSFDAQGAGSKPEIKLLSKEQESGGLEKWTPGASKDDRQADLKQKQASRDEMQDFARQEQERQQAIQNQLAQTKTGDFEAGRTMTDTHGNLVRVDQRLLRPDASSIQIVNLVKRTNYNYAADGVFGAPSGLVQGAPRLDSMQYKMSFGRVTAGDVALPDSLQAWPAFFDQNKDIKAQSASLILANQSDPLHIFAIAYFGTRDNTTDKIVSTLNLGAINCVTTQDCLSAIGNAVGTHPDPNNGNTPIANYMPVYNQGTGTVGFSTNDPRNNVHSDQDPVLHSFDATPFNTAANGSGTKLWLTQDMAVINNDGSVKSISDFTASGLDPLTVLKNTGGEIDMMVKGFVPGGTCPASGCTFANVGGDFNPGGSFGALTPTTGSVARNIDLVIVPDLAIAVAETFLTSLSSTGSKQ